MATRFSPTDFLDPKVHIGTLDTVVARRAILQALQAQLIHFQGTLLDIGCGYMPYKSLVLSPPSRVTHYLGLDLATNPYQSTERVPDLEWDGQSIPLADHAVDCAIATEVLEHCPNPELVLREAWRVLKPGGLLFFTVPFLWPLHTVPHDEYRYTPFALRRHLEQAGFQAIDLQALGGWDASLAQMVGLWVRRRWRGSPRKRALFSSLALPLVWFLSRYDRPPDEFYESCMLIGLAGTATKPLL